MNEHVPANVTNPWKTLRRKARAGIIIASEVEEVLSEAGTASERLSRLRFVLRLRRWVDAAHAAWPLDRNLERDIAAIYGNAHDSATSPAAKVRYASWARRYGLSDFDWPGLHDCFLSVVNAEGNLLSKLALLRDADAAVIFDLGAQAASVRIGDLPPFMVDAVGYTQVVTTQILARESSGAVVADWADWKIALNTDVGPKPPNQDAAVFAGFADGSCLAAVADGTGDSHDGARAAEVALQALTAGLAVTGDLKIAAEHAATSVRADNLSRKEENACTLVALHIRDSRATLIHLSDSFLWLQQENGSTSWSSVSKAGRTNVGGEPLGDTITSGGNVVQSFLTFGAVDPNACRDVQNFRAFVLGSDGSLSIDDAVGESGEPPICIDFDADGNDPSRVATRCCHGARAAMAATTRSPDNITCVAGFRKR